MNKHFDTPRLELKGFEDKDLHAVFCIFDDNKKPGETVDFDEVVAKLNKMISNHHYYALVLKQTQAVIGIIYCKKLNEEDFEIGYLMNKNYKNSGYATEALYGFTKMLEKEGAKKIVHLEDGKNAKPYKLLENEGFLNVSDLYKVMNFMKD